MTIRNLTIPRGPDVRVLGHRSGGHKDPKRPADAIGVDAALSHRRRLSSEGHRVKKLNILAVTMLTAQTRDGEARWSPLGHPEGFDWTTFVWETLDGTWVLDRNGEEVDAPVRLRFSETGTASFTKEVVQVPGSFAQLDSTLKGLYRTVCNPGPRSAPDDDAEEPDEDEIIIRAKWTIDNAATLEEAARRAEEFAEYLHGLHAKGYVLREPVEDDYGFAIPPAGEAL
jgi:hypothetical protein